jgi:ribosomal protein S27AE
MPYFCPYCSEVFLANIHRHDCSTGERQSSNGQAVGLPVCPECGYFLTQQLEEI